MPNLQLLSHLGITPDFPNHPLFDVMVIFHEEGDNFDFSVPDTKWQRTWTQGAKLKIMAEFAACQDESRLGYGAECFEENDIRLLGGWIL